MGSFGIGFPLSGASPVMWVFYNARVTFRTTSVSIHTESATQQGWSAPPTRYRRVIMPRAFHSATFMLPQCNRGREGGVWTSAGACYAARRPRDFFRDAVVSRCPKAWAAAATTSIFKLTPSLSAWAANRAWRLLGMRNRNCPLDAAGELAFGMGSPCLRQLSR